MTLNTQVADWPFPPSASATIPLSKHQIGSWQIAISRRPHPPKDLASRYDAVSRRWARTAQRFHLETAYRAPLLVCGARALVDHAGANPRALDCGIGCGSLTIALNNVLPKQISYSGIDMSGEMLATADAVMCQAGLSAQLQQADVRAIPYPDQTFDIVMAAHVLEHLPDPQRALGEMVRVLKPGGLLFVCMTRRSLFGALIQLVWRTWAVTERQGAAWLRDCQLTDIGVLPVDLGSCAGKASLAFWARRPARAQ